MIVFRSGPATGLSLLTATVLALVAAACAAAAPAGPPAPSRSGEEGGGAGAAEAARPGTDVTTGAGAPVDRPYVYEVPPGMTRAAPDTLSTLQVSGRAEVEVPADRARIVFAVETEADSAARASRRNAERMESVLSALRQLDVEGIEIETRGYSLRPRYRRPDASGLRTIEGYTATNQVVVTASDLDRIGELIDTAVGSGANRVASLTFLASDTEEPRMRALEQAVAHARREAETIAGAMGLELGRVLEVTGGADAVRPFPEMREQAMAMADTSTPVEPGTRTVSASVNVRYGLVQGPR